HRVVDRRRLELVEPGVATAPVHHEGAGLDLGAAAALITEVRASAERATAAALDELAADLSGPVVSLSLRNWPDDFAACATARGWSVHRFDASDVEEAASALLGD